MLEAYFAEHQITEKLNTFLNEMVQSRPEQPYISDFSWMRVQIKRGAFRCYHNVRRQLQASVLQMCWQCWLLTAADEQGLDEPTRIEVSGVAKGFHELVDIPVAARVLFRITRNNKLQEARFVRFRHGSLPRQCGIPRG